MPMGKSTEEIYQGALEVGTKRLEKSNLEILISAFIAGLYVAFGGIAALTVTAIITRYTGDHDLGWLFGSMVYPIAFIFVVIGKSELFTENFVSPVMAVWEGMGTFVQLSKLWSLTLIANLIGILVITTIMGGTEFVTSGGHAEDQIVREFMWVTNHALEEPFWSFFWKSIFAGLLINFMSWLVIAAQGGTAKLVMIWIPGFLIMLMGTHHSIVGSTEILMGYYLGYLASYMDWFAGYFLPAALGNAVGGVVFVAALHHLQASVPKKGSQSSSVVENTSSGDSNQPVRTEGAP